MKTKVVYVVTSYGKVMGCFEDSQDAFAFQTQMINKNRLAELVPCSVTPSSFNAKSVNHGK